jgi:cell pole-organizing protein PopZ
MQTRAKADEAPRLAARASNTSGMTRLQQLISQQPVDAPSVAELLARIRLQTQQAHGQPAQIKPAQCQHTQSKNTTYQGQP